jgi:alkanesulfonate monooxygenase SsuD/methylene tetrahydromethanopterin reductase-like flavin-dependent oxidoreductase (luciferase family)
VRAATRVGLFLTNQQPVGRDMRVALAEQLELLGAARDADWDSVFTGHHYLADSNAQLQPVPFLARLAAESGEMQLGIGILLLTVANPVAVAEEIASLDIICGGRLILGVGLGYRDVEFAAFGVDKRDRLRRFEANLEVIRRLWAGEEVTVDLPWCSLDAATLTALPVQRPGPEVWIGATGEKAVARAGRLTDGWLINPAAEAAEVKRLRPVFDAGRDESGRTGGGTIAAFKEVYCAPTRDEAVRIAGPYLEAKYRAYDAWGQAQAHAGTDTLARAFEELRSQRFIVGSPEDCLRELLWWRDEIGVEHFLLRTNWAGMPLGDALASVRLLSSEVLPGLRT